ncbi:hypothetical protein ACFVJH_00115 [Streptomyces decoyicus]|uniref:hypothetical protein n=1 Tax=Streptomyces decoyicus TaxID=249567 RepID=UPI003644E646
MNYNEDWDRRLNPFRYNSDGTLTDAARKQNVAMQLNSANADGYAGAGSGQASVHIATLTKAASALEEIRSDTDQVGLAALNATDASVIGLQGWESAGGLGAMRARWADEAVNFSEQLSDACANLHNTATAYKDTDREEQARMNSINHGGK